MTNSLLSIPRVSVLMTVFNAGPYLREAIESILGQDFHDWEAIIVENGSTDASPAVIAEYSDSRLRVFSMGKNVGRIAALRFAFDQVRGEYIAVLDADDVASPDRFTKQVALLDRVADVALVGSWTQFIDENGKVFDEFKPPVSESELQDSLGWLNPIVHSSAMYRTEMARRVGGYSADFAWGHDFALTLALAQNAKIAMIDEFLCKLRVLATSMTRSRETQFLVANENLVLFRRAGERRFSSRRAAKLSRRSIAVAEAKLGLAMLRRNSILSGLVKIFAAIAGTPSALWGNGPVRRFFGANY